MNITVLKNLKLPIRYTEKEIKTAIEKAINLSRGTLSYKILKKSLDARKKDDIRFVYTLQLILSQDAKYDKRKVERVEHKEYLPKKCRAKSTARVAIIGAGPCGLFSALTLAEGGVAPVVFERGS